MFLKYNWTAACWQFRIGRTFTDFRYRRGAEGDVSVRSWPSLKAAKEMLTAAGCKLVRKSKTLYEVS